MTEFTYDYLNRQIEQELPLDQTESMHYDDTPIITTQQGSTPERSVGGGQLEYERVDVLEDFSRVDASFSSDNPDNRTIASANAAAAKPRLGQLPGVGVAGW